MVAIMTEGSKEVARHRLVPLHEKLTDKEKKALLDRYKVSEQALPYITITDPALRLMEVKVGDVIKISRASGSAGQSVFYRVVINDE